ncbi:MAG: LacI family DNA-binding transcriptional regulator [Spirochaetota bacterium]
MATIRDVAKSSGVSIATVSRVLNKKGKYSKQTENRVYQAVEELGYTLNLTARSLKTGLTGTIGLGIQEYYLTHFPHLVSTLLRVLKENGFSVEAIPGGDLKTCRMLLAEGRFDGLLIIEPQKEQLALRKMIEEGGRFVVLGGDIEREDVNMVEIDYFLGGYITAKKLIHQGHRQVLFIEENPQLYFTREIKRGFLYAMDENGIPFDPELILQANHKSTACGEYTGYRSVKQLVHKFPFTAVLATEDRIAYGVLKAAEEEDLPVPDRLSVIGFGNTSTSAFVKPPLTTVEAPLSQMGELGAEILVNNIKRKDRIIKRVKLNINMIERATTSTSPHSKGLKLV